jgi:hypothetical protein
MFTISEQIEDIKTAIISSIGNAQSREVARGVIRYRRLSDFLYALNLPQANLITDGTCGFDELLRTAEIVKVRDIPGVRSTFGRSALIKADGTFYEMRLPQEFLARIAVDWASFIGVTAEVRRIIFEAIADMGHIGSSLLRYRAENFETYFADQLAREEAPERSIEEAINDEQGKSSSDVQLRVEPNSTSA